MRSNHHHSDPNRLLTYEQVARVLGVSTRTVRRMRDIKGFPRPIQIGCRAPRFRESDIAAYIRSLPTR